MTHELRFEITDAENGITLHTSPTDDGVLLVLGQGTGAIDDPYRSIHIDLDARHAEVLGHILLQIADDRELVVEEDDRPLMSFTGDYGGELGPPTVNEQCDCEACHNNQGVIGYIGPEGSF